MNWRAIGCGSLAIIAFLGIGLLGLSMAGGRVGCLAGLQWGAVTYVALGSPAAQPRLDDGGPNPVPIGSTFVGLTTRRVYGPPGTSVAPSAADGPARIAMECGDGTYQLYRRSGTLSPRTTASP